MAIEQLTPEQARDWTAEEKDRWWLAKVYRGDMPQLTLRAGATGFLLGGILSATNLYIGAKTGWTLGVGLTSVILAYASFRILSKIGVRDLTILENNAAQSVATAAGYMTGPLISGMAAYMWIENTIIPWWQMAAFNVVLSLLGVLVAFSFNTGRFTVWEGFSLVWYRAALADPQLAEGLWNSLVIAGCAASLATIIGTLVAYGMWRRPAPLLAGALYLSLLTPEVVTGVSLLALFQGGFRFLHLRLGFYTVIAAHTAFSLAYVMIVVSARLRQYDRSLEEAAMDLGATEWGAFRRVTLPYLTPAIASAALLALVVSFDDYVITSLVAGIDSETLPMVVYAMARRGVSPVLNAVSAFIIVGFGSLIVISQRLQK